jgi:glycosyltransferase involved in cell wall biosynthesis
MSIDNTKKNIWITWEKHRRTRELAKSFCLPLFEFRSSMPRLIRYFVLTVKSILVILHEKPSILIIQCPSMVLFALTVLLKPFAKYKLICDAHNAGVYPDAKVLKSLIFVYAFLHKHTDVTIVTNEILAEKIHKYEGVPYILPDKLPILKNCNKIEQFQEKNIAFICTFAYDEPYKQVIEAFRFIYSDVTLHVTGDFRKAKIEALEDAPKNVTFKGYLSDRDYEDLLYSCDCIIDLTRRKDCMVCGAYEGVSLCKPLILSDTKVLRKYFNKGVVFTDNTVSGIVNAINELLQNINSYRIEINGLKGEIEDREKKQLFGLVELIESL